MEEDSFFGCPRDIGPFVQSRNSNSAILETFPILLFFWQVLHLPPLLRCVRESSWRLSRFRSRTCHCQPSLRRRRRSLFRPIRRRGVVGTTNNGKWGGKGETIHLTTLQGSQESWPRPCNMREFELSSIRGTRNLKMHRCTPPSTILCAWRLNFSHSFSHCNKVRT